MLSCSENSTSTTFCVQSSAVSLLLCCKVERYGFCRLKGGEDGARDGSPPEPSPTGAGESDMEHSKGKGRVLKSRNQWNGKRNLW